MKSNILAAAHQRKKARLLTGFGLMLAIGVVELCLFWRFSMATVHTARIHTAQSVENAVTPW